MSDTVSDTVNDTVSDTVSETVRQRWHGKSVLRQAVKPSPFAARGVSTSFAGTPRTGEFLVRKMSVLTF